MYLCNPMNAYNTNAVTILDVLTHGLAVGDDTHNCLTNLHKPKITLDTILGETCSITLFIQALLSACAVTPT